MLSRKRKAALDALTGRAAQRLRFSASCDTYQPAYNVKPTAEDDAFVAPEGPGTPISDLSASSAASAFEYSQQNRKQTATLAGRSCARVR